MTEGRVLSGIEFARAGDDGSRPLLLDLYLPGPERGAAPRPAVVHFHGGGWRLGERSLPASESPRRSGSMPSAILECWEHYGGGVPRRKAVLTFPPTA